MGATHVARARFRPSRPGVAHWFSFEFDRTLEKDASSFVASAHGDLDGDGQTSTFEVRGSCERAASKLAPGMYVDQEVE